MSTDPRIVDVRANHVPGCMGHAFPEYPMADARYGDVFARPQLAHDLRIMFVRYGTNEYGEGWFGIEIGGLDIGEMSKDYVEDGWLRLDEEPRW